MVQAGPIPERREKGGIEHLEGLFFSELPDVIFARMADDEDRLEGGLFPSRFEIIIEFTVPGCSVDGRAAAGPPQDDAVVVDDRRLGMVAPDSCQGALPGARFAGKENALTVYIPDADGMGQDA